MENGWRTMIAVLAFTCMGAGNRAGTLLAEVRSRGAHAVVRDLWAHGDEWSDVMEGVSSGSTAWLDVAVALAPGTDAGSTSELLVALFLALRPAPEETLGLFYPSSRFPAEIASVFNEGNVCGGHVYIDYQPREARRLIDARIAALRGLPDGHLNPVRQSCLRGLVRARALNDGNAEQTVSPDAPKRGGGER
jgi:hypothetical protein